VLTCADGLGRLFIIFVRGQLYPGEGEVVVVQDLVQVGRSRDMVWCFTSFTGGMLAGTTIGALCAVIRLRLLGLAVTDAELFVGLYSPYGGESDGLCGRIDRIRNVRSVGTVEEGACDGIIR
jgi:hypothetical protein